jgi:dihydroorotate dehydrogenase electron transfer subunit
MSFRQYLTPVVANYQLARNTYLIRLHAPALAAAIRPGQFVMIRSPKNSDPLLARPFALYDTVLDDTGKPIGIDVVYLVVGKMTGLLAGLRQGDTLDVWGPLGNGFPEPGISSPLPCTQGRGAGGEGFSQSDAPPLTPNPSPPSTGERGTGLVDHVALVAGGIGQTPFLAHIRELLGTRGYAGQPPRRRVQRVSLYYGVRTKDLAAGVDDFQSAGAAVHLASDDGTLGHRGFVTDLLAQHEPPEHLFGCGPEPMLHALASQAERRGIPCHLSLETPMACGVGICFSCVTPVKTTDGWDYKRVCVDGPVFDAKCLQW